MRPDRLQCLVRGMSLAIVLAVALYIWLTGGVHWHAFHGAIAGLPLPTWVALVFFALCSYLLRFMRWHAFMASLGHRLPLVRHLEIYLAAFALTLTPGKMGELVRSVHLLPYGVAAPASMATFVTERLLDLFAVALLALIAIGLFPQYAGWLALVVGCLIAILWMSRTRFWPTLVRRITKLAGGRMVVEGFSTIRSLLSTASLLKAAPLSLMAWMAQGLVLFQLVQSLGYALPLILIVSIYCLGILAGAASFIPGGMGATEAAMVLLLVHFGVSQSDAMAASIIARGVTLGLAVTLGLFAMLRLSLRAQMAE